MLGGTAGLTASTSFVGSARYMSITVFGSVVFSEYMLITVIGIVVYAGYKLIMPSGFTPTLCRLRLIHAIKPTGFMPSLLSMLRHAHEGHHVHSELDRPPYHVPDLWQSVACHTRPRHLCSSMASSPCEFAHWIGSCNVAAASMLFSYVNAGDALCML